MAKDVFEEIGEQIDNCPETCNAVPAPQQGLKGRQSAGTIYAAVGQQLRAQGVPILMILLKFGPIILDGIQKGKTVGEIVQAVLDAFLNGG